MKPASLIAITAAICLSGTANAQTISDLDTTRKHELTVNIVPILLPLAGAYPENHVNFQVGYRHYLKTNVVLRAAFSVFPNTNNSFMNGLPQYVKRVDDQLIFMQHITGGGVKWQLNLGLEKIFRVRRLQHGVGADLFVSHKFANQQETYFHEHDSVSVSVFPPQPQRQTVDSLGFSETGQHLGMGFHIFYSVRMRLSERWYVSANVGPSFLYSVVSGTRFENSTKQQRDVNYTFFEYPNVPLISDVSIGVRF